jgi:hypothetical protein
MGYSFCHLIFFLNIFWGDFFSHCFIYRPYLIRPKLDLIRTKLDLIVKTGLISELVFFPRENVK